MQAWTTQGWQEVAEIKIPIASALGRNFKGVFTTLLIKGGRPVWVASHIRRVLNSAFILGMVPETGAQQLADAVSQWPQVNSVEEGAARLFIWQDHDQVRTMITGESLPISYSQKWRLGYAKAVRCSDDITVQHKTLNRMVLEWERLQGVKQGWDDVVFCNQRGEITETSRGNLFWYADGVLNTPDISSGLLPGIGREQIITWCERHNYPLQLGKFTSENLATAEGLLVVNSLRGIIPVVSLDKQTFAPEHPGIKKLQAEWWEVVGNSEKGDISTTGAGSWQVMTK